MALFLKTLSVSLRSGLCNGNGAVRTSPMIVKMLSTEATTTEEKRPTVRKPNAVTRSALTDFGKYVAECLPKYMQKAQLTSGEELEILICPEYANLTSLEWMCRVESIALKKRCCDALEDILLEVPVEPVFTKLDRKNCLRLRHQWVIKKMIYLTKMFTKIIKQIVQKVKKMGARLKV